jgi:hypothetical protein
MEYDFLLYNFHRRVAVMLNVLIYNKALALDECGKRTVI